MTVLSLTNLPTLEQIAAGETNVVLGTPDGDAKFILAYALSVGAVASMLGPVMLKPLEVWVTSRTKTIGNVSRADWVVPIASLGWDGNCVLPDAHQLFVRKSTVSPSRNDPRPQPAISLLHWQSPLTHVRRGVVNVLNFETLAQLIEKDTGHRLVEAVLELNVRTVAAPLTLAESVVTTLGPIQRAVDTVKGAAGINI